MRDFTEEIDKAIDLLFKVSERAPEKKNLLDKGKVVYLQVVLFKIPVGAPQKRKYLRLRHSLYGDDPEICLFVPNRQTGVKYKKTTDEFIDFCIDYYTELLEKHKVKGIKTIMPLKQLRSEYGTYNLRRKLVQRFDLFLCKNSLLYNSRFLSALGKIFFKARKNPLGVSFPKEDVEFDPEFQKSIERAIFTSPFVISRFSDNYSIPFGCLTNTKSELKENLETVLNQLFNEKLIPGGLKNVRAMNLWPSQSKPVPLYINTELPVGMKTPRMILKKKKRSRGVEGEISTQPNKKVFVMQNGEVFVTNICKNSLKPDISDSEGEDSFVDESDNDEMEEEKKQNSKPKDRGIEKEEESESEDDEEIEEKEMRLMKEKLLDDESFYTLSQSSRKMGEETENENKEEDEEKDEIENNEEEEEEEEEEEVVVKSKLLNTKQKLKFTTKGGKKSLNQKTKLNKINHKKHKRARKVK